MPKWFAISIFKVGDHLVIDVLHPGMLDVHLFFFVVSRNFCHLAGTPDTFAFLYSKCIFLGLRFSSFEIRGLCLFIKVIWDGMCAIRSISYGVGTAAGTDADTPNRVGSAWSKLKGPLLDAVTKVCSFRQEPPVEIWNLVVEWTGARSYTKEVCTVQSLQCPEEGRHDGGGQRAKTCLHWWQVHGTACHLAGKVWGREIWIRHSILRWWWCFLYRQTDGPHIQERWWWELCMQWYQLSHLAILASVDHMLSHGQAQGWHTDAQTNTCNHNTWRPKLPWVEMDMDGWMDMIRTDDPSVMWLVRASEFRRHDGTE